MGILNDPEARDGRSDIGLDNNEWCAPGWLAGHLEDIALTERTKIHG